MCLLAHSQKTAFTISYTKYNTYTNNTNNSLYYWLYQNCRTNTTISKLHNYNNVISNNERCNYST